MALIKRELKPRYDEDYFKVTFENKGDSIEGVLLAKDVLASRDGDSFMRYVVEVGKEKHSFLGCFQIDEYLRDVKPGTLIKLVFTGRENIGDKRIIKSFDFYSEDDSVAK